MSQKRTLNDWEKAECAALKALVEAYNRARPKQERITQEAAGAALGITQGAFSNYLNARIALNKEVAAGISRLFGIPVEKFSKRLAAEMADLAQVVAPPHPTPDAAHKDGTVHAIDFSRPRSKAGDILIPQYDVRASMGSGQALPSGYVDTIRHIAVSPDYLREAGVAYTAARNLAVVTGFGESMNKTFSSGDPLIIDRGVNELVTDGVYLFTLAGMLYIKRLQLLPGKVRMISDNDAFPPYDIQGAEADQLIIHARVLLAWNARKL